MSSFWECIGIAIIILAILVCAKSCKSEHPILKIQYGQTIVEIAKP